MPKQILVLADTHNRLPANMDTLAADVQEIWHLGDVCQVSVLEELRSLGPPLTLVRGNCDRDFSWPESVNLTRNGIRFRLQHVPPRNPPGGIDVLLHGHTHVPRDEMIAGVRFLNPGCVTRPNRGAPASIAFLRWDAGTAFRWTLLRLRQAAPNQMR